MAQLSVKVYQKKCQIKLVISALNAKHSEVLIGTQATISCVITGLTKELDKVTWEKPNSGGRITDNTDGFVIDVGTYNAENNSQTTVLTIPGAQNTADASYTCVIQSEEHGKQSEQIEVMSKMFSECISFTFKLNLMP